MATGTTSFYFHDYETFGADPRRDPPTQFAGQRTDLELNPIDDPISIYCKPNRDRLMHPEACLITGITPQQCEREGLPEREFFSRIEDQFSEPGTCALGYNSIRFDDEITRHGFYRNFFDPYAREWQNGCSRWDVIDLARACFALRPEGINWPQYAATHPLAGQTSFRLEDLARANQLDQTRAHDALSDVYTCITLLRLIKKAQPKLFNYFFTHRDKHQARSALKLGSGIPLLHVSSRFPSSRGCLAIVLPIAETPDQANKVISYDLNFDPRSWFDLSVEDIRERVFVAKNDLPEEFERIALKQIHLNRAPILAPINTLSEQRAQTLGIDIGRCLEHAAFLQTQTNLAEKLRSVFATQYDEQQDEDPDLALYSGGLISRTIGSRMAFIRSANASELRRIEKEFKDKRFSQLLFRYRAKYFSDDLTAEERERWDQHRRAWLSGKLDNRALNFETTLVAIQTARQNQIQDSQKIVLLDQLESWTRALNNEINA